MKDISIFRVPISKVEYSHPRKMVTCCIIHWINPITKGHQVSKGFATCSPDDKFDEEFGRKLAESRAKIDVYITYNLMLNQAFDKIVAKNRKLLYREYKHEDKLIKEKYGDKE